MLAVLRQSWDSKCLHLLCSSPCCKPKASLCFPTPFSPSKLPEQYFPHFVVTIFLSWETKISNKYNEWSLRFLGSGLFVLLLWFFWGFFTHHWHRSWKHLSLLHTIKCLLVATDTFSWGIGTVPLQALKVHFNPWLIRFLELRLVFLGNGISSALKILLARGE